AYGIMYSIPDRLTPYHLDYAIISIVIALVTTVVAALFATLQELRSTPANLMQPRAPKPGKRDRKSTRLNSSHVKISYAVFCLKFIISLLLNTLSLHDALPIYAYGIMYSIPDRLTPYHLDYAIISIVIALVTTVVAALFATLQELRSTPANLMQPRAPKPGK